MATTTTEDFTTPDRKPPHSSTGQEEKKEVSAKEAERDLVLKPATVTPPDSSREENLSKTESRSLQRVTCDVGSPEDRHVRFDKEMEDVHKVESPGDSPSSTGSQRGLVSRRGGRCASPGRITNKQKATKESTILEFKTYRSPTRKREDSDNVPSLCSASSAENKEKEVVSSSTLSTRVKKESETSSSNKGDEKPVSISCDSTINQTSPLAPDGAEQTQEAKKNKSKAERSETGTRKNNVTFSPVPPSRDNAVARTPTRSPTRGQFQSLPNLDDATLRSPGPFLLSPQSSAPFQQSFQESGSFDMMDKKAKSEEKSNLEVDSKQSPKMPKSPRTPRREDRDRFVATPTDFATDYGKHPNSGSFDNSNVLAWLQSPTANGLFSPGGFSSMLNTPRGAPRTPRTPTVSTSFFFSDVAGLPRSDYNISPKPGGDNGKRGGRGYSNIICISPLASSKGKNGANHSQTPTINYKEMFLSPAERSRGLSLLGDSPMKGLKARGGNRSASRDPSIDAVHMAERDLMEDEDLSVLLQLASNTPSRSSTGDRPLSVSTSDGTQVFRPPNARSGSHPGDENLPSLQLPIIGGRDSQGNGARLSRKTHSRDHGETADGLARPLEMRPKEAAGSKHVYPGNAKKGSIKDEKDSHARKDGRSEDSSKKGVKLGSLHPPHPPYPLPHAYEHPGGGPPYPYPPMPPGMPHGGSMRVVVGGPPPPPRGAKASGSPSRHAPRPPYPMGPGDPNYPPPPYPPPPGHYHHPGVPPPHMHPHYGRYPPPHHPRAHMPMYGAQHPTSKSKPPTGKKHAKPPKAGSKRASPTSVQKNTPKKTKKSSPPKKKNKSPQITDKVERQKAAATIQAVNAASGGKNDRAAALAAAILRGVTMRPSGKWQAQLYFAGKSRYIGVFDTREKAALAYEIAREKLKSEKSSAEGGQLSAKATEAAVTLARKAAFEGVNERDPRLASK